MAGKDGILGGGGDVLMVVMRRGGGGLGVCTRGGWAGRLPPYPPPHPPKNHTQTCLEGAAMRMGILYFRQGVWLHSTGIEPRICGYRAAHV